jgi:hypothetical protein
MKAQAAYVVWRDGAMPLGNPRGDKQMISVLKSLPAADPGSFTTHRWRKRSAS